MCSTNSTESVLTKGELQSLVASNDPSISFMKPANVRSDCWTNFSQIYHGNISQDYVICLHCKTILKWTSTNGTRVMSHHNCLKSKLSPMTPRRQRTISSYCQQNSLSREYPVFQRCITEACVEYCAVDGRPFESVSGVGFMNLVKQLVAVGARVGSSVSHHQLLPHPSTVSTAL